MRRRARPSREKAAARFQLLPRQVWAILLDPKELAALLPGCDALDTRRPQRLPGRGGGGHRPGAGRYVAEVELTDLDPPRALTLSGTGIERARLRRRQRARHAGGLTADGTRVVYRYDAAVGGKVAAVGGRMLDSATRMLIGQFFDRLIARAGGAGGGRDLPFPCSPVSCRLLGLRP